MDPLIDLPLHFYLQFPKERFALLIARHLQQAQDWQECLLYYGIPRETLHFFPDYEILPYDSFAPHPDLISSRLQTLARLAQQKHGVLITTVAALCQRLCPQSHFDRHGGSFHLGDTLPPEDLRDRLQQAGYQRRKLIQSKGEFALRGNVLDLFPMGSPQPLRIEWFDDQIESLRSFDLDTQNTLERLTEINLLPGSEIDASDNGRSLFRQQMRAQFGAAAEQSRLYADITQGIISQGIEAYLPLFFSESATLFDYLPAQCTLIDLPDTQEYVQHYLQQIAQRYRRMSPLREDTLLPPDKLWLTSDELEQYLGNMAHFTLQKQTQALIFQGSEPERWQQLIELRNKHPHTQLYLSAPSKGQAENLAAHLRDHDIPLRHLDHLGAEEENSQDIVSIIVSPLYASYALPNYLHVSSADLSPLPRRRSHRQSSRDPSQIIRSFNDLHIDDPIVHLDHGIGRYQGLERIEDEEMLVIAYAGGAKLYVSVSDLDRISKYSGASNEDAPLHSLDSHSWQKNKKKIKKTIRDTAAELLKLQTERRLAGGLPIAVDRAAMHALSADFPFEETADQRMAIEQVFQDLEAETPMDRILCGDVGFGKTEVAIRAACACMLAGYQVAVLAPTTLLVEQHNNSFQDRLQNYPFNITSLSRFKSAAQQRDIIKGLQQGSIDLVIGTHRLLQNDVHFKKLGLIIADEEQRFGVRHKNKLKQLRHNVNLLTLTATPIPRTLNLGLSGLRDLSIIATAPEGRQSIQTRMSQRDPEIIREAAEREFQRGGQIFYMHNNISDIERVADQLQALLPQARIGVAHGQMPERDLERVMLQFYNRHSNLLLATTIIESGIDIPNANTILIDRADKLGLAQLHQLRGRVGRSRHQAYAYLFIPPWEALNKDAQRRLEAFTTIDSLGAGFLLAGQDMDIRGAGEILGEEQSGKIEDIGVTLYLDMLERSIRALENDRDPEVDEHCRVDLGCVALLPEEYIYDPHQRLILYQRISRARDPRELDEIHIELIDRFGHLPEAAQNLFFQAELKLQAQKLGITELRLNEEEIVVEFQTQAIVNPQSLILLLQERPDRYKMQGPQKLRMRFESDTRSTTSREVFEQRIRQSKHLLQSLSQQT